MHFGTSSLNISDDKVKYSTIATASGRLWAQLPTLEGSPSTRALLASTAMHRPVSETNFVSEVQGLRVISPAWCGAPGTGPSAGDLRGAEPGLLPVSGALWAAHKGVLKIVAGDRCIVQRFSKHFAKI